MPLLLGLGWLKRSKHFASKLQIFGWCFMPKSFEQFVGLIEDITQKIRDPFPKAKQTCQDNQFKDILAVIKISVSAADRFWHELYQHGIWIPRHVAEDVVKNGWKMTDSG